MEEQGREKVPLEGRTPEKELEKQEAMGVGGGGWREVGRAVNSMETERDSFWQVVKRSVVFSESGSQSLALLKELYLFIYFF